MDVPELIIALAPLLDGALIATDFDGTVAPLMPDPEDSRAVAGAIEALTALSGRGAQIAVVTGRDARTAVRLGGLDAVPGIVVAGLYGAELWQGGELRTPDTPETITTLRERLPAALDGADPAVWIEDKRLSLVVHARRAADPRSALAAVAEPVTALGRELGLEVHPGSGVLELRLPGYDKSRALGELADGHRAVLYLGDDLGDLPAFERIASLQAAGVPAWGVAVLGSAAESVTEAADVALADPPAVVDLFRALVAAADRG